MRLLLGDSRETVGAPYRDPAERSRRATQLPGNNIPIGHAAIVAPGRRVRSAGLGSPLLGSLPLLDPLHKEERLARLDEAVSTRLSHHEYVG